MSFILKNKLKLEYILQIEQMTKPHRQKETSVELIRKYLRLDLSYQLRVNSVRFYLFVHDLKKYILEFYKIK